MTHLFNVLDATMTGPLSRDEKETLYRFQQELNEDQSVIIGDIFTVNTGCRKIKLEIVSKEIQPRFYDLVCAVNSFLKGYELASKYGTPNFETLNKTGENEMNFIITKKEIKFNRDVALSNIRGLCLKLANANFESGDKCQNVENIIQNISEINSALKCNVNYLKYISQFISAASVQMNQEEYNRFNEELPN